MLDAAAKERFLRWYLPHKARVCEEVRPFSHGKVFRSARYPDYWDYNCIRVERPMTASEMIAAADRELADCAHRLADWVVPMPDSVVAELRALGWIADPLIFMLHDGRALPESDAELVETDYDAVLELRELWYREDFGQTVHMDAFHNQARELATLNGARVIAALRDGQPVGFAQVDSRDGASEVSAVFVRAEQRGAGIGRALTARAIRTAAEATGEVWICALRDGRPRRLYERLGFRTIVETGVAILPTPRFPILTRRLRMRPLQRDDLDALAEVYLDPRVDRWIGPHTRPDVECEIAQQIEHQSRFGFSLWAVEERSSGRFIGDCGLQPLEHRGPEIELGYDLHPDVWGQGLASEAAAEVMRQAFGPFDLEQVVAVVKPDNFASQHVLENAGLRRAGSREAYGEPMLFYTVERPSQAGGS